MTRQRRYDFSELADYKAGIRLLRRFAPEKFSAKKYPLRGLKDIKQLSKWQRAQIRENVRFLRPMLTYGYRVKRVKDPESLRRQYQALYGLSDLPKGLKTIPMPVNKSNAPLPVKYERYTYSDDESDYSGDFTLARVQLAPGVEVARLHFADIGMAFDDLIGDGVDDVIAKIFEEFRPSSVAMQAGVSVAKVEGAPFLFDNPEQFATYIKKMQGRYSNASQNNYFANWMGGVDLYFTKNTNDTKNYMREEMDKYKARKKLAASLKWQRDKRAELEKKILEVSRNVRALSKKSSKKERAAIEKRGAHVIKTYQKKIATVEKRVQQLAAEMYRTESF